MQEPENNIEHFIQTLKTSKIFATFFFTAVLSFTVFAICSFTLLTRLWPSLINQDIYVYSGFTWAATTGLSLMSDPN